MTTLRFETGSEAYPAVARYVLARGARIAPRSLPCVELCDVAVCIEDAARAVPVASGRTGFKRVGAAEYCQLLAGVSWLEQLDLATNGKFGELAADDGRLRGAYGPRIYDQLPVAAAKLQEDQGTRQAVVVISRGVKDDAAEGQRDVPCTVAVQYRIRAGKLDATVMMRSSDLWLGIPADWWMQSRLQMTLAWALNVPVGTFTFFAGSLHVYEKDVPKADALRWEPGSDAEQPPAVAKNYGKDTGTAAERLKDAQIAATRLVFGNPNHAMDIGAAWYAQYVPVPEGRSWLCNRCRYVSRSHACEACGFPQGTFGASQEDLVTSVTGAGKEARKEE